MKKIVKRKITGFFKKEDIDKIKNVSKKVSEIISDASILVKQFYLEWFEKKKHEDYILKIDEDLINLAILVVQGKKYAQRTKKVKKEDDEDGKNEENIIVKAKAKAKEIEQLKQKQRKNQLFKDLSDCFFRLSGNETKVKNTDDNDSYSHVLLYATKNLMTAYENNITMHFDIYPKKLIRCHSLQNGYSLKDANKFAWMYNAYFMYDRLDKELETNDFLRVHKEYYESFYPSKQFHDKPRCYDLIVYPMLYLFQMVRINRELEVTFFKVEDKYRKLFSPLPFHSSFIPMHIRIDTSALVQLLIDQEKIEQFKTIYYCKYNHVPNIKHKGDVLSRFSKIFPGRVYNGKDEHNYATELWNFLTNLQTCRRTKEIYHTVKNTKYIFDNSVVTDGISISFQVVDENYACRKKFGKKKVTIPEENIFNDQCSHDCDNTNCEECKTNLKSKKALSGDPGKGDIVVVTDGIKSLSYKKSKRNKDTKLKGRRKEHLRRRSISQIDKFECEMLSKYQKKTCFSKHFALYYQTRNSFKKELKENYESDFYRQCKFLVYTRTRSSEMKFFSKVFKVFKRSSNSIEYNTRKTKRNCIDENMKLNSQKEVSQSKDIVIAYGNGGQNMNALKGTESVPNKGLKRRMGSFFIVRSEKEHYSSQTCPCCKCRSLKNPNFIKRNQNMEIKHYHKHHLLRCTNDCNSSWWNRNVAGSFNILKWFLESLNQ